MPFFTSPTDSARLYYRDYVPDDIAFQPKSQQTSPLTLVFLHGWPMSSRMFEHVLPPLCESYRFRCIAPDRRGFGQSDWTGYPSSQTLSWEVLVADLVGLLTTLKVDNFIFIGASMDCTESLYSYQTSDLIRKRCKGFVWIGPVMPYPLQSPSHPLSPSIELWETILDGLRKNRPQFVADSLPGIFAIGAGNGVHPKVLEHFERIVAEADGFAIEKTVSIFNQPTDTKLQALAAEDNEIPIIVLHGDADQGIPLEASAVLVKDIVPWVELKVYKNAGHGLYLTHANQLLDDILAFVQKLGV